MSDLPQVNPASLIYDLTEKQLYANGNVTAPVLARDTRDALDAALRALSIGEARKMLEQFEAAERSAAALADVERMRLLVARAAWRRVTGTKADEDE